MNQQKKPRSSNFELLRITAMLMIISYHIFFHCISAQMTYPESPFTVPVVFKKLVILNTIAQFGNIGNALFLILSGFFMIRKGKNIEIGKTAFKLLTQLGFSVIVLIFASMAADFLYPHDNISLFGIDHFNGGSWYIGYYFMVIVLAFLLLNSFLAKLDRNQFRAYLLTLFACTQFTWSSNLLEGMAAGFELLATGVFLYSVGAYIYLFDPMQKFKTVAVLLVIPVTYGLIYVSSFNADRNSIRSYIQSGSTDPYSHNIPVYGNSSLVILILAIVIFELFRRIKLRRSAVINFLGAGTFMVYLLHDNTLFYTWWDKQHWTVLLEKSPIRFLGSISLWTFITFGTGIVAYAAYLLLCKLGADCKHLVIRSD